MSDPIPPDAPDPALPPSLRLLKWLVVALTLTMIGGVITVVALLVTRMPQTLSGTSGPTLPEELVLPAGVEARAVTFGQGWTAIVTGDDRILIFDQAGTVRQEMAITLGDSP